MKALKNILLILILLSVNPISEACTVAVISGKYTKDHKPLLWKNRDTWAVKNKIVYFTDGKYTYLGLVNSSDKKGKSVWIGTNIKGFSIMNSASYNLNLNDTNELTGHEGRIIKKALATCANLKDFEALLDNLKKPTGLEANFGVIDANGGAAMYEIGNQGYVKFDANDPKVAPFGYILRTNYSFMGTYGKESSGYIRYNTVNELFYNAASTNSFDAQFIIQDVTRCLKHSLVKSDLYNDYKNISEKMPTYCFFKDFVPRTSSASSVVIEGVKKGDNPDYATMWSVVGFPLTSIAIPTWIKGGENVPEILCYREEYKNSPICNAALILKKECFPIKWGKFAARYININALVNADNSGILQKVKPYEDKIFAEAETKMKQWKKNSITKSGVQEYYNWVNKYVSDAYKKEFNIEL